MVELVVCTGCRRHVAVTELTCPFCAGELPTQRPQRVLVGRLGRAAMLSAVLAACDSKPADTPAPVLAPAHESGSGSDDLEQLLDVDHRVVERASPADAAVPDAAAIAQAPDAGLRPDAGVDPALAERKRRAAERRREKQRLEALRLEEEQRQLRELHKMNHIERAKPYGAPPARRRVV